MGIKFKGSIALIFTILFIVSSTTIFHSLVEGATLYFEDIQGDSSVLEDVTIKGIIRDRYHAKEFTIKNNRINKRVRAFTHYKQWKEERVYQSHNVLNELRGNVVSFYIRGPFGTTIRYLPGIEEGVAEGKEYSYGIFQGNNFTVLEDVIYFTFNTPIGYKGVNGIFKAEGPYYRDENNRLRPTSLSRIVTLDLDETDNKMNVLGITAMNNTLYLITLVENILTVTAYDPLTGQSISKTSVELDWRRYHNGIRIQSLIFHEQNQYLHLELLFGNVDRSIITFDMSKGIEFKSLSELKIEYESVMVPDELVHIYYVEDQVFAFVKKLYRYGDGFLYVYNMLVYKDNALLYHGELVTDIEEDYTVDNLKREALYQRGNSRYRGFVGREIDKIVVTKSK